MDSAEDELTKRARDIDENKIQSLLDVSLAITSDDQYKDDVRIKMFHYDENVVRYPLVVLYNFLV